MSLTYTCSPFRHSFVACVTPQPQQVPMPYVRPYIPNELLTRSGLPTLSAPFPWLFIIALPP
jgi:hypothetical protein